MAKFYHYNLEYCEIFVLQNVLIKQIKEGEVITTGHISELQNIIDKHFKDQPVVYISNRTFSYSVDPMVYKEASKIKNLLGIGIIETAPNAIHNAQFEGKFYEKEFDVFSSFDEAMIWMKKIIDNSL